MDWTVIFCLIFMNTPASHGDDDDNRFIDWLNSRRYKVKGEPVVGASSHPDIYTKVGDDMKFLGKVGLRPSPGKLVLNRAGFTKLPRNRRLSYNFDGQNALRAVSNWKERGLFMKTFLQKLLSTAQQHLVQFTSPPGRRSNGRRILKSRKAEDVPGHRLIQPTATMLKSAAKFPHENKNDHAVYGNVKNLGFAMRPPVRVKYSDFRKNVLRKIAARKKNPRTKNLRKKNLLPKRRKKKKNDEKEKKNDKEKKFDKEKNATQHNKKQRNVMRDKTQALYGNMNNLGIIYAKTPFRLKNTDFRRSKLLKKNALKTKKFSQKKKLKEKRLKLGRLPRRNKKKRKEKLDDNHSLEHNKIRKNDLSTYGNMNNLGIIYAKTPFRLPYSDFRRFNKKLSKQDEIKLKLRQAFENGIAFPGWRRANEDNHLSNDEEPYHVKYLNIRSSLSKSKPILDQVLEKFREIHNKKGNRHKSGVIILHGTSYKSKYKGIDNILTEKELDEENNDASEILDDVDALEDYPDKWHDFRKRKVKSAFRNRTNSYETIKANCSDGSTESDSDESTQENNPGNPYTIHKNKYKTNWIWNLAVTGDHMNINPYGPTFGNQGPTGAQLFFGRKWWYFNQDDYKPFR